MLLYAVTRPQWVDIGRVATPSVISGLIWWTTYCSRKPASASHGLPPVPQKSENACSLNVKLSAEIKRLFCEVSPNVKSYQWNPRIHASVRIKIYQSDECFSPKRTETKCVLDERERERLSLSAFLRTVEIGVHIVHISCLIITYTLE